MLSPAGQYKRVYINKKVIEENENGGRPRPVVVVHVGDQHIHAFAVRINGPCRVVYEPSRTEGPKVWIETEASVAEG